jgi:hypothetical protein
MKVINCYRFVKNDLTSENGDLTWKIGEWNQVNGEIICCSNGLHASLTPRDSLKNVYGQKWFVSEANGEIVNKGNKFAASEMRIIREIPMTVLQRFAVWCAADCLKYYEDKYPNDKKLRECIQAVKKHLDGQIEAEELAKMRTAVSTTIVGMAASRAVASAVAAALSILAPNFASWANAAAAASYAAHLAGVASDTAIALVDAQNKANNVETVANAAITADKAAIAAHRAAAAGAIAHAAAVSAARNTPPPDTPSDVHYSSFAAFTALDTDEYYAKQNEKLTELIEQAVSNSQQKYGGTTQ